MGDYNVLHFATHGAIVVGTPEDSFILFGDGTPVTIADVRNWNLNNVDLVVFSAGETGLILIILIIGHRLFSLAMVYENRKLANG